MNVRVLQNFVDYSWPACRLLPSQRTIFLMWKTSGCCRGGWGANVAPYCSPSSCLCDLLTPCCVREWQQANWLWPGCSEQQQGNSWTRAGGQDTVYLRSETLGFGDMTPCKLLGTLSLEHDGNTVRHFRTPDTQTRRHSPEGPNVLILTLLPCSPFIPNASPGILMRLSHLDTTLQFELMQV